MNATPDLGSRIARLIEMQGPLSIAQFMTIALHDPDAGYYATHNPLGTDFVTAPEITQAFGELVGLWCAQAWHDQGKPPRARLVELGPGRGTLMADVLRAARLMPEFLAALEVVLVENSAVLSGAQKEALAKCGHPVRWVTDIGALEHDRALFVIANEFFDALPVRQFVWTDKGWCERVVASTDGRTLSFALAAAPALLSVPVERGEPGTGAVYEMCPAAIAIVEDVARGIARHGGAALFIDYGYAGGGFGETLQAIRENAFVDVLASPGEADISAHVDFSALARAARAGGAEAFGPVPQGEFLLSLGIRAREKALLRAQRGGMGSLGVKRLVDPDQMGTLFKALAVLPKRASPPPGFAP